ncbi:MAG: hypothetical protein GEU93_19660 [Propionibacteriales bacterium]|nr:hypothetical protein [Propionibacteriales bacterium]
MDFRYLVYERIERVARVTLNRPNCRNALSRVMQEELESAFAAAVADEQVGAILVDANGPIFSAGHDLGTPDHVDDLAARPYLEPPVRGEFEYSWEMWLNMPLRWRDLPKPTIAAVHGLCIYGGWKLASAMDIVVAADDAKFVAGPPQWMSLPWDVGPRIAKAILLDD